MPCLTTLILFMGKSNTAIHCLGQDVKARKDHAHQYILSIHAELSVGQFWINPYSAWIGFSRQNLTSVDVRFLRLQTDSKSIPAL